MIAAPALLFSLSLATASVPEFTDPSFKGHPFPTDFVAIPAAYQGHWAADLAQCRRPRAVLRITRHSLNGGRVSQVHAYSDHPAIFVRLRHHRNVGLGISLDISLDEQWLRRGDGFGSEPVLLRRCPTRG